MSLYMQLTVTVQPYYRRGLGDAYPKLAKHLGYVDKPLVAQNPSLYELAGHVDKLLYAFDGTRLREVMLPYREKLVQLHEEIGELIAEWKLAPADRRLYELEDLFDDLEGELD